MTDAKLIAALVEIIEDNNDPHTLGTNALLVLSKADEFLREKK